MSIAIAFALDAEFRAWRGRHAFVLPPAAPAWCFEEPAVGIRVALIGVGARRLPDVADWIFQGPCSMVIAAGLSGALRASVRPGDVIAPLAVCRDALRLETDPMLLARADRAGAARVDRLVTADRIASTAADKRRLAASGDCVDMESFHVLDAARRRGIPGIALRVIGDASDEDLPLEFESALDANGDLRLPALAIDAARHPARWPRIIRFAAAQLRARRRLADVLDTFVGTADGT